MVKSAWSASEPLGGPPTDETEFRRWLHAMAGSPTRRGPEGLGHARGFFEILGNPQNRVPAIHVVGTAGKGTTAHLITRRLVATGLSVATHMSPHVYDPRERFLIDGNLPDWSHVIDAAGEVYRAADQTHRSTGQAPSYFAVTAAMSWVIGRRADTDILVIEAGVGGRNDATNVIDRPDRIVVVTAVGLDHADVLGATAREIAAEKVAVFQGCAMVVMAPQSDPAVVEVVSAAVRAVPVELVSPASPGGDWRLDCDATAAAVESIITGLPAHSGMPASLPPGRLETIEAAGRTFVLDGAHNPIKLAGLADVMRLDWPGRVGCVVAAIGRGKDLRACARALAHIAPVAVATSFDTEPGGPGRSPRSWSARELADAVAGVSPSTRLLADDDAREAVMLAHANSTDGDVVVVTGSFMYLAAARAAVLALPVS